MQEKFGYLESLFGSVKDVFKEPIIMLPFLFAIILSMTFNAFDQFYIQPSILNGIPALKTMLVIIAGFLVYFLINVIFTAMGLATMRMKISSEKITVAAQIRKGASIYLNLFALIILEGLLILIPVIIVAALFIMAVGGWNAALTNTPNINPGLMITAIVLLVLFIIYAIWLVLSLFYASMMVTYGKGPVDSIRSAMRAFRHNKKHELFSILSMLLLMAIVVLALLVLTIIISAIVYLTNPAAVEDPTFTMTVGFITDLIMLPFTATITLYLFKSFKALPVKKPDFYPKVK